MGGVGLEGVGSKGRWASTCLVVAGGGECVCLGLVYVSGTGCARRWVGTWSCRGSHASLSHRRSTVALLVLLAFE